jgi:hypothetical protein
MIKMAIYLSSHYRKNNFLFYIKLFCVALAILGARLYFIDKFASPVPFWDDYALGQTIFLPWIKGTFKWCDLFAFHNMHIIFFTRLSALLLFIFNDYQWDVLLGMSVNALIATLNCMLLILMVKKWMNPVNQNFVLLIVTLLWITPNSWGYLGNILWNIQSCWYFLIFFSLVAMWGTLFHANFSIKWWLGIGCGFFAFLSNSGGITILLAVAIHEIYLFIVVSGKRLNHLLASLVSIGSVIFCVYITKQATSLRTVTEISFVPFLQTTGSGLAWPQIQTPWLSLLIYLPFFLLLLKLLRSRRIPSRGETFTLVLGGWIILLAMILSYGRNDTISERYLDIYPFGIVANFLAGYLLISSYRSRKFKLFGFGYAILVWLPIVLFGLYHITTTNLVASYPSLHNESVERLKNTREFISGNKDALDNRQYVPVPNFVLEETKALLANPVFQAVLPYQLMVPKWLTFTQVGFEVNGFPSTMETYQGENVLGSYGKNEPFYGQKISESEPITIHHSFMEIPVIGYLGEKGLSLKLIVEGENKPIEIVPPQLAKDSYISVYVRTPARPFKIVAIDNNPDLWFAFAMPRGIGILSFANLWLLDIVHVSFLQLKNLFIKMKLT